MRDGGGKLIVEKTFAKYSHSKHKKSCLIRSKVQLIQLTFNVNAQRISSSALPEDDDD